MLSLRLIPYLSHIENLWIVEIGVFDSLDFLYLFENSLTGSLPSELGNLGDVDFFYAHENMFTG